MEIPEIKKEGDYLQLKLETPTISTNISTDLIIISEDRLTLILKDYKDVNSNWMGALGTFITLILSVCFCTPGNVLGISKDTIWAILIVSTIMSCAWLTYELYLLIKYWKKRSVLNIINEIKDKT